MLVKRSLPSARISSVDRDELHGRLKAIAARIRRENPEVADVRLFGSFAREDFTGRSDVDVLIVLTESSEDMLVRTLRFRKYFELELPVDVLVLTESEIQEALRQNNAFLRDILRDGVSI